MFIQAIALIATATAVVSYPILGAALVREGLSEDVARHVARHVWRIRVALALVGTSVTVWPALLPAPRDQFESMGIGLTLVKKVVESYGGRVWVASEVGKGSTFSFTFPRRRAPATVPAVPETESRR